MNIEKADELFSYIEERLNKKLTDKDKFAIGMIMADIVKDREGFEHFKARYENN